MNQRAERPGPSPSPPSAADVQQLIRDQVLTDLRAVARPDSRFHWDLSAFIADFEGSDACAARVQDLAAWRRSEMLFITPDNSTEFVRRAAMADGKPFLMTTYGIRRGFLLLDPESVPVAERSYAATLDGMDRYAREVGLAEVGRSGQVGLLVTGGTAVTRAGVRLGKGHGYFDLEWALLSEVGVADASSEIVDVVHDCQVVDVEVPAAAHDAVVDWIVTPTRTLRATGAARQPGRVRWELIGGTELADIPPILELAAMKDHRSD